MAKKKRITRTLILRILAVGLFVCLGTFAVMHSIQNQAKKRAQLADNPDQAQGDSLENSAQEGLPEPGTITQVSATETDDKSAGPPTAPPRKIPEFSSATNGFSSARSDNTATNRIPTIRPKDSPPKVDANKFSASSSRTSASKLLAPLKKDDSSVSTGTNRFASGASGPPTRTPSNFNSGPTNITKSDLPLPPLRDQSQTGNRPNGLPPVKPKDTPLNGSDTPSNAGGFSPTSASDFQARPNRSSTPADQTNPFQRPAGTPDSPSAPKNGASSSATETANSTGVTRSLPNSPFRPASSANRQPLASNTATPSTSLRAGTSPLPSRIGATTGTQTSQSASPSSSGSASVSPRIPAGVPTVPSNRNANSFSPAAGQANTGNPNSGSTTGPVGQIRPVQPSQSFGGSTPLVRSSSSSVPARNALQTTRQSTLPPLNPAGQGRPSTSLASTPLGSGGTTSIASPTPGDRTIEGVQLPMLAVQKIAPREIQVNRQATFELLIKNTGKAAAENVQIHDYVPAGTRLVETIPNVRPGANGQLTWNLGTLAPGQQSSIKMKLVPQRAGDIGSVAHVTFGAMASAKTVCTQPKLTIRHEAPSQVLLGQNMVMNIFVENTGNGAAENVVLQEDVPEGLEFVGGQKELEYEIGTLAPGQTRRVQLPLRAAKVGQARNVLVVHGAGNLKADDLVDIRVVAPKLNLRSDGPNRKFLNRQAKHTFTLDNQGTAPATNLQMIARLPRGLRFVSSNNQGQYDPNQHAVLWRLSRLDAQKSGSVELTTTPVAVGKHDIQFTAAADLNQRQETTKTLTVEQLSELFFDIDDIDDAIEVGTSTTYRVRVVNQGRIPANNVRVQVEFAPAIKPASVQGDVRHRIQGQTVVLDPIPSLQPGQEVSFVITGNALQAGEHRTVVSVRSDDRDIAVSKEESTHVYSDR